MVGGAGVTKNPLVTKVMDLVKAVEQAQDPDKKKALSDQLQEARRELALQFVRRRAQASASSPSSGK